MFKEIKLPFNLSFMEFLTLIFFLTLGYFGIYRYSFYNTLGIPWYINTITPSQFFTSSFECIYSLFIASVVSFFIYKISQFFKSYQEKVLKIVLIIMTFIFFLNLLNNYGKLNYLSFLFNSNEISTLSVVHYVLSILLIQQLIRIYNTFINQVPTLEHIEIPERLIAPKHIVDKINNDIKASTLFLVFIIFFMITSTPYFLGKKDAYRLLNNKENLSNLVKIKANNDTWYLIEVTGDKVLLIKKNTNDNLKNDFKLIEYKDIEKIVAIQKEDSDRVIFDYISESINR